MAALTSIALGAAVIAPIAGGVIGSMASAGDRELAEEAMKKALAEIEAIGAPPDLAREILVENITQAGLYTPEVEKEINLGISKIAQIPEDPELRRAQRESLELLRERGRVGLTPMERAQIRQVRNEAQKDLEAKRQQIVQSMQARGIAGGGQELALQLQAAQAGTEAESQALEREAGLASERALESMTRGGAMAGRIAGEEFERERVRKGAEEAIERFNVEQAIGRQLRNVGRLNEAQLANLREAQRIQEANIAARRAEKERQRAAEAEVYGLQLGKAQLRAGTRGKQAEFYGGKAGQTAQMWSGIGGGVGAGAGALASELGKQQRFKKYLSTAYPQEPELE